MSDFILLLLQDTLGGKSSGSAIENGYEVFPFGVRLSKKGARLSLTRAN